MPCPNLTELILECQPAMMFVLLWMYRTTADSGKLRHGPLGLVFLFRTVTQGYTLGWDTDQPFGLSGTITSAVTVSLLEAQRT